MFVLLLCCFLYSHKTRNLFGFLFQNTSQHLGHSFLCFFYGFSGPISDVGGPKKNENKIKDLSFFSDMLNNKKLSSHRVRREKNSVNNKHPFTFQIQKVDKT